MSLEALVNGQAVDVGSDTESAVLDPTVSDNAVQFTITPASSLAGADLQALDLRVHIHGPNIDAGYIGLSGKSYVDVPSFSASVNRSVEHLRRRSVVLLADPRAARCDRARRGASRFPRPRSGGTRSTPSRRRASPPRRLQRRPSGEEVTMLKRAVLAVAVAAVTSAVAARLPRAQPRRTAHQPIYMPDAKNIGEPGACSRRRCAALRPGRRSPASRRR